MIEKNTVLSIKKRRYIVCTLNKHLFDCSDDKNILHKGLF